MELETILDVTLKGYDKYQTFIEKLYPGQPLYLEHSVNSNGYDEVFVKSNLGIIGELFSEDVEELLPYLKDPDKFYIKTSLKKHYIKERIKLAVVVIIEVFKKDKDFVAPVPVFLGDYITNYDKYIFGFSIEEDCEITCSLTKLNKEELEDLDEYELLFLKISNEIVEVYKVGAIKIGELNKENSSKIINYLRNEDYAVEARIKKVSESRCRIEIFLTKKKYIMKTNYLKDKSLLIEGVEVIGDDGKTLLDEEKELILSEGYTLEEDIRIREEKEKERIERRKRKEEQDEKSATFASVGCLLGVIGIVGLLFMFIRYLLDMENPDFLFYPSVILSIIGIIPLIIVQGGTEQNKEDGDLTKK
nr:MAG TPA: hypothetical protein [Caudoviricetes sp.]